MRKMKRFVCLFLCLCMVVSLTTMQASTASYVNKLTISVTKPYVGDAPAKARPSSSNVSYEVVDTQWEGELDADGRFKSGEKYTVIVTIGMKEDVEKYFLKSNDPGNYTINSKTATIVSHSRMKVVLSYTFEKAEPVKKLGASSYTIAAPVAGEMPTYLGDNDRLIRKQEWLGIFNADGSFKVGEIYTSRITLTVKDPSTTQLNYVSGERIIVNGHATELIASNSTSVTFQFRFAPVAEKVAAVPDEDGVLCKADFYYVPAKVGEKPVYDISVAQSDALYITDVEWSGVFDENGCFKAKTGYTLQFTVNVRDGVNMTIPGGSAVNYRDYFINGERLTVTFDSGNKPSMKFSTNVEVPLPPGVVDMEEVYTQEQADAVGNEINACDVIITPAVIDEFLALEHPSNVKYYIENGLVATYHGEIPNIGYATRLLVDVPLDNQGERSGGAVLDYYPNLTEVWLSPDMDVSKWVDGIVGHTAFAYEYTDRGPNSWDFVLYISGDKYPEGYNDVSAFFRVRLYYGDVYEAFEQGGDVAGHDWCTKHEYTKKIMTPDRICKYATCQNATWFWYSCQHCGKPERNDNHVFKTIFTYTDYYTAGWDVSATDVTGIIEHSRINVIDEKYFIGYNADGDKLYAQSCRWCGASSKDIELCLDLTEERYLYETSYKPETDLKSYQEVARKGWEKNVLPRYLSSTSAEPPVGYFVVESEKTVTATTSTWAANEVKWAAQSDLIDFALLGNDYTKEITRLQFCSVVVRMAEKLLGEEIAPAAANSFTDTDNLYALKAVAAGITKGVGDGRFDPNGTLTREQMATFVYRALMYVRDNSDVRFTIYEPSLESYSDYKQIDSWYWDAFGFMNALGLIKGTSSTVLNPDGKCTIEQALLVAYRSLSADKIGWYQCTDWDWDGDAYFLVPNEIIKDMFVGVCHAIGDRVWVSGVEGTFVLWLKVESRDSDRSNTTMYLPASEFKPIKDLMEGDAELYDKYVP